MNNDKTQEKSQGQSNGKNFKKPYYNKKKHRNNKNKQNNKQNNNNKNSIKAEIASTIDSSEVILDITDEKSIDTFAQDEELTPIVTVSIEDDKNDPKICVAGVRFKPNGKIYYFDKKNFDLTDAQYVIVDTARGLEFGEVACAAVEVKESSLVLPLREVVRIANKSDIEHNKDNKQKEVEAFATCAEKINAHGLEMKLIEAQYSFDNSKLLFYFSSANRVDFRELVKDLAGVFKTRIELRQIGIRDEAKLMGGLGVCGRPLCCSTFLSDFVQVSIKMAKEQNLSLNSGKISGCCGRLMCCLQYEYKTYVEETAKTPPVDSVVKTAEGVGVVTEINPLGAIVKVKLQDKPDSPPVAFKRDDVTLISRPEQQKDKND